MPIIGRRSRSHSSQKHNPKTVESGQDVKKINQQPGRDKNKNSKNYDPNR